MLTDRVTAGDGVELSYRVVGCGSRDVFLLHGWMTTGAVFDDLIGKLDTDGLRVIIPDLRGGGKSDRPEHGYSIERYAADVLTIADRLTSRAFIVVGHSMGGQIAQWLAATSPGRVVGQVLLCPMPSRGLPLLPELHSTFRGSAKNRNTQKAILELSCREVTAERRERMLDDAQTVCAPCIEESFDAFMAGFPNRLSSIIAPTVVVCTDDPLLPHATLYEAVVAPISGARMAVLPGPAHYPQVERPGETAALLQAFLSGVGR